MVCQPSNHSQHCQFCHCTLKPHYKKQFHTVKQGLSLSVAVHELVSIMSVTGCSMGSPHQTTHADNAAMQLSQSGRAGTMTTQAWLSVTINQLSPCQVWCHSCMNFAFTNYSVLCAGLLTCWLGSTICHLFLMSTYMCFNLSLVSSPNHDCLSNVYGILNNDQYSYRIASSIIWQGTCCRIHTCEILKVMSGEFDFTWSSEVQITIPNSHLPNASLVLGFGRICSVTLTFVSQLWQSRVEIKHYSVAYFDRITAFEGL